MVSESIYESYKNPKTVSIPPNSPWALGIGNTPKPYPLSFKADETVKDKNRQSSPSLYGIETNRAYRPQDFLNSYREESNKVVLSPSALQQRSILSQTTPARKKTPSQFNETVSTNQKSKTSRLSGQTDFDPLSPPSSIGLSRPVGVLKRPSQISLSQYDEKLTFRPDSSIATTFDPETDKHLYEKALNLYRSFSKESKDNESFFWE